MTTLADLKVKIFADGADRARVEAMCAEPWIRGFTTNPTLMRSAGVDDYESFAHDLLELVPDKPDLLRGDRGRPRARSSVRHGSSRPGARTSTSRCRSRRPVGEPTADVVRRLSASGDQGERDGDHDARPGRGRRRLARRRAGRLRLGVRRAYRGLGARPDPDHDRRARAARAVPARGVDLGEPARGAERRPGGRHRLPRHHGHRRDPRSGCSNLGRELDEYSLDTVRMFYSDAEAAGYMLDVETSRPARWVGA